MHSVACGRGDMVGTHIQRRPALIPQTLKLSVYERCSSRGRHAATRLAFSANLPYEAPIHTYNKYWMRRMQLTIMP